MPGQVYEFDGFQLDTEKRLLSRAGAPIPLTPRVFETLLYLVEHSGVVLAKERLMEAVWPDSIVEENNLTQNISALRRVFGETPGSHRYIVTVPGRGYRFVANVRAGEVAQPPDQATIIAPNGTTQPGSDSQPVFPTAPERKTNVARIALMLLVTSALITTGIFAFRMRGSSPLEASTTPSVLSPEVPVKSIAVLPFENLSADAENAYLATGIQEEILSNLAQIADLKVISRTSASLYKVNNPRNAHEIGRQLGVAHLLEGSVQRSNEHLRVHAQLIDTRTDSHLWAQTYNRELADVFAIQSEIAQSIADQLHARISEREKDSINQPATNDLVANGLYLQALELESQVPEYQNHLRAVDLLEQAVARDPHFYLAYCALSRMNLTIYLSGYDHTIKRQEMVKAASQKAIQLQPNAGEGHLVQARYFAFCLRDYDRARVELDLARRTLPNDPAVYHQTALIDRRQGRWTEAARNFERALELDPRNPKILANAASTYSGLRRYADAALLCQRCLAETPRDYWTRLCGPGLRYDEYGDVQPLRAELNAILAEEPDAAPKIADDLFSCAIAERDVAAADRALAAIPAEGLGVRPELVLPREWFVGYAANVFNRPETARVAFETARTTLENLVSKEPDNALAWSSLGLVEASLGRKEEAIKAGRRACDILPLSREATSGVRAIKDLAKIYARLGEKGLAIEQLAKLAEREMRPSYGDLLLDPDWDPLRSDPRFEKMVANLAPKAETR